MRLIKYVKIMGAFTLFASVMAIGIHLLDEYKSLKQIAGVIFMFSVAYGVYYSFKKIWRFIRHFTQYKYQLIAEGASWAIAKLQSDKKELDEQYETLRSEIAATQHNEKKHHEQK